MKNFNELINGDQAVLVDFSAEWCGPCKMMAPVLERLKRTMGDSLTILKVDIDKNPAAASVYQVRSVPTLMLFKKGHIRWRHSGVVRLEELQSIVGHNL